VRPRLEKTDGRTTGAFKSWNSMIHPPGSGREGAAVAKVEEIWKLRVPPEHFFGKSNGISLKDCGLQAA